MKRLMNDMEELRIYQNSNCFDLWGFGAHVPNIGFLRMFSNLSADSRMFDPPH